MPNIQAMTPGSLTELQQMLEHLPADSKILAGGTDLIIAMRHKKVTPSALLYVGNVTEMVGITCSDDCVRIGASTSMQTIADDPLLRKEFSALCDAAADIGSAQIRHNATIGGNIGNASPAADLTPSLWLFGASAEILSPQGSYTLPVSELVLGAEQLGLKPNEVIINLILPRRQQYAASAYTKVGSRSKVTISRVGVAFAYAPDTEQGTVVLGAVTPTPVFAPQLTQLTDSLDEERVESIGEALSSFVLEVNQRPNRFYKSWAVKGAWEDACLLVKQRLAG